MKPQDFLSKAENSLEITFLSEYKGKSDVWDYYFNYTGYLNGMYFCIYFSSVSEKERIEISELTKNQEEFKKFFGL
jgi:hypothetical protein